MWSEGEFGSFKAPQRLLVDNMAFDDSGSPGEEKGRVEAVEGSCGLGWGFRKREGKCGSGKERERGI